MKKQFYYDSKNMYLDKLNYPRYKRTNLLVHRYAVEKHVRKLKDFEQVHHVNGDKKDYRLDNLVILSKKDHKKIEKQIRVDINLIIAYEIIIILSFLVISGLDNSNLEIVKIMIWILLFIGLFLPFYPKILRKLLFKFGILKKHKK